MLEENSGSSDLTNVHRRIDEHNDQLATLATLQAKTDTQLLSLTESVSKGFADNRLEARETRAELRSIADRMHGSPTNWPVVIGVSLTALSTMAAFLWATLAPIKSTNSRQDSELSISRNHHDDLERQVNAARVDDLNAQLNSANEVLEIWKSVSRIGGQQGMIIDRQDDIDNIGSRYRQNDK